MPDGEIVLLVNHSLIARREDGSFSAPTPVGPAGESMISRVGDRVFIAYREAPAPDPTWIPVLVRQVLSSTSVAPPIDTGARTGAETAAGSHAQKRSSIGGLAPLDLLLAWDQPRDPGGGYRSIWVATLSERNRAAECQ